MGALDLSDTEQQLLIELLEREIPSLRDEVWHTDDHEYREALKERERRLKALLEKLKGTP
ncbi:MAG: hypothetical protein AB1671_02810 [Thermodesulfobacteriota bacterium]